jgi:hypothetical protein
MRLSFVLIGVALLALPAAAQGGPPQWSADPKTGCRVWNSSPEPGDSISWTGGCRNGLAQGPGVLQWFMDGKPVSRFEGGYRDGLLDGKGVYTFANGARYEGEYADDLRHGRGTMIEPDGTRYEGEWRQGLPNGQGTLKEANGTLVSGTWTNGCLREGGRIATFMSTRKTCGFE